MGRKSRVHSVLYLHGHIRETNIAIVMVDLNNNYNHYRYMTSATNSITTTPNTTAPTISSNRAPELGRLSALLLV